MAIMNWNIIIIGESGVGKTSMAERYVTDEFKKYYQATILASHLTKNITVRDKDIELTIWDTAGQEIHNAVVPQYFRIADGCIVVYDVTKIVTFHKISNWLEQFRLYKEDAPVIIAGNKSEDPNCKAVALTAIKSYAQQENMEFLECSAKTGDNIEEVFDLLFEKMYEKTFSPPTPHPTPCEESSSVSKSETSEKDLSSSYNKETSIKSKINIFEKFGLIKPNVILLHEVPLNPEMQPQEKKYFCC